MKVEQKAHDTLTPAGEERDPDPGATLYFTVWGFALLFASIFFLQALTWGYQQREIGRKGTSDGGALKQLRADHDAKLKRGSAEGKPINQAMNEVTKQYGKGK